ncbi:MAG: VanW family protein [Bacillota bacterium]
MNKKTITILLLLILFSTIVGVRKGSASRLKKIQKYNLHNILATHTTYFDNVDGKRATNIKIAAKKISGTVLQPGEIFSFNKTVGPRTKKNGFKEATEIVNNEFVTGVGGGVCQVSSTLYNSALFAGLEVIDRKNHSRPVNYVPLGRGAAVYYGSIDFKFKNNFSKPIMVISKVVKEQLTVTILGTDPGINVKVITSAPQVIDPEVVEKSDNSLTQGVKKIIQKGKVGYKVTTRRIIKNGSAVVENELISEDIYPPIKKIIKASPENN